MKIFANHLSDKDLAITNLPPPDEGPRLQQPAPTSQPTQQPRRSYQAGTSEHQVQAVYTEVALTQGYLFKIGRESYFI